MNETPLRTIGGVHYRPFEMAYDAMKQKENGQPVQLRKPAPKVELAEEELPPRKTYPNHRRKERERQRIAASRSAAEQLLKSDPDAYLKKHHSNSVFVVADILRIRREGGSRRQNIALAKEYGVSCNTIYSLVKRKTFAMIPEGGAK